MHDRKVPNLDVDSADLLIGGLQAPYVASAPIAEPMRAHVPSADPLRAHDGE
jgi:hypothetical protein